MAGVIVFSVIVPTFNRAASLQRLLESLAQSRGVDEISTEVIVVNNGSTDRTAEVCATMVQWRGAIEFRAVEERIKGKSSALNCGLAMARGSYLMVLDDDVIVDAELIRRHFECFQSSDFAAVQGRILPGVDPAGQPTDPSRLREYNIPMIDYGDRVRAIRGLTGTNMSFKREVFETVGGFDPRLGPGASGFSEDTEFSRRVRDAGFKIGYTPHAAVYHELDPARYGSVYNRMVEYRKGRSRSIYRQDSLVLKVLPNLIANCLRWAIYKTFGRRQKAYKTEGRIMKCCGQLVGSFKLRCTGKLASRAG